MNYDAIICSLPYNALDVPPCAPALLKGIAEEAGFSVYTKDLSVDLYEYLNNDTDEFFRLQDWFINTERIVPEKLGKWLDSVSEMLAQFPADSIALSVFSGWTQSCTLELIDRIKKINPTKKIVCGGRGLTTKPFATVASKYNIKEKHEQFHTVVPADDFILGDGEESFVRFLRTGNTSNREAGKTLDYPFPNFDNYDFTKYIGYNDNHDTQIPIVSSKGCVRACDFCDVAAQMPQFKWKSGRILATEMAYLADKYKLRDFALVDSILNGNMRQLEEAITVLAEYNKTHEPITWNGNWICRPKDYGEEFYKKLSESGCKSLTIGVEHGSDHVLMQMNKKTDSAAFWREIKYLDKYGIKVLINLIVGHWSETWEDFVILCETLTRIQRYVASGTVQGVFIGQGFSLLDDTPAARKEHIKTYGDNWTMLFYSTENPDLGFKERMYRLAILSILHERLNLPVTDCRIGMIIKGVRGIYEEVKEFQKQMPYTGNFLPEQQIFESVDKFTSMLVSSEYKTFKFKIEFNAQQGPHIIIQHGDNTLFSDILVDGNNSFEFDCNYNEQDIEVSLINKHPRDTLVDTNGNIISDKKAEITILTIDNLDIVHNYRFVEDNVKWYIKDELTPGYNMGFWQNSRMIIPMKDPIQITSVPRMYSDVRNAITDNLDNDLKELSTLLSAL